MLTAPLSYAGGRRFTEPSTATAAARVRQAAEVLTNTNAWCPAITADGGIRDGAWVAEATGVFDLSGWPDEAYGSSCAKNGPCAVRRC